jgi:uncharacterized protein (DUF2384 family)
MDNEKQAEDSSSRITLNKLIEISGLTLVQLSCLLDLTDSALRKYLSEGQTLSDHVIEHVRYLQQLFRKGADTFGSTQEFIAWLSHEHTFLHVQPYELLNSISGINLVIEELMRIDHGITV